MAASQSHAMQNALKNPFPDDFDPDSFDPDSMEEAGEKVSFKYKRPLLSLLALVLVVGAFSLFWNQKRNEVATNNLPKPTIDAPPASKKEIDRSPKAVEKLHPTPVSKPLDTNEAYKRDKEYLALTRYERFQQAAKPVKGNGQKVRATVAIVDKPLTLGGRGFDFKRRQPQAETDRFGNFAHRLEKPYPKMDPIPEDHLDLQLIQTKSSKDLIFHPVRPALGKYNRQKVYLKGEKPDDRNPQALQAISDTKLLLMEADNSLFDFAAIERVSGFVERQ